MTELSIDPEKRGSRRVPVRGTAIIVIDPAHRIECELRNLSAGGARLSLAADTPLPATFELWTEGEWPRPCHLVWQVGHEAGVSFAP